MLTVEAMVESMLRDYCHIIKKNQHLNDELENCTDVVHTNFNVILQLENENTQLKEQLGNRSSPLSSERSDVNGEGSNKNIQDCRADHERFQQILDEKDKMIEELMIELECLKLLTVPTHKPTLKPPSHESDSNGSSVDALEGIKSKIRDLEKIAKDWDMILEEKRNKLLEQQARIDQLESRPGPSKSECKPNIQSDEHDSDREKTLAQQLALCQEQIDILMDERKNLMKINDNLMKSISTCQMELCSYNFEC